MKKLMVLTITLILIFVGCSNNNQEGMGKNKDLEDPAFPTVTYKQLLNGEIQENEKFSMTGRFDEDLVKVFNIAEMLYEPFIYIEDDVLIYIFQNDEFRSRTQAANFNFEKFDMLAGKEGFFKFTFLGFNEGGKPIALLEEVNVENKVYTRDDIGDVSNSYGSIKNPSKPMQWLDYIAYDYVYDFEITLLEVLRGEDAKKKALELNEKNSYSIENNEILMAKFKISNHNEPYNISQANFKYAGEDFIAHNDYAYIKGNKMMDFTVYADKEAEGWVAFKIDKSNKKGYAIFNDELWFELY